MDHGCGRLLHFHARSMLYIFKSISLSSPDTIPSHLLLLLPSLPVSREGRGGSTRITSTYRRTRRGGMGWKKRMHATSHKKLSAMVHRPWSGLSDGRSSMVNGRFSPVPRPNPYPGTLSFTRRITCNRSGSSNGFSRMVRSFSSMNRRVARLAVSPVMKMIFRAMCGRSDWIRR
jgi:hypothetical protein